MNLPIYKIKEVKLDSLKKESQLDKWYFTMIQKSVDELSLLDISRMLRQNIYLDIAIPLTWKKLLENPFCGELYDGQLLELLVRVVQQDPEIKRTNFFEQYKADIEKKINDHEWNNDEEKEEYISLVKQLEKI